MNKDPISIKIREINVNCLDEINLVASRMQQTLIEVLGEEKGKSLYSLEWLKARVLWHLDITQTNGKIFLTESNNGTILGHAITRIETDKSGAQYGYFSTIFIEPSSRSKGIADSLMLHVEGWLKNMNMPKIIYNTAENHIKIIKLFSKHKYEITYHDQENRMIQLTKII